MTPKCPDCNKDQDVCSCVDANELRAENEKLTKQVRSYAALVKSMEETKSILLRNKHNQAEATATLESEREANKQLTEELNEQARLLGISAEKELALLTKVERLERELAKAKKDAERLKGLRELCGYVEDGSSQTIRITQDDATKDWIIRWNDKAGWVFSSSFKGAIDEAMKGK